MRRYYYNLIIALMGTLLLMACSRQPEHVQHVDQLPVIYPDYVDVTIPVGIAPLNFAMANDSVTTVDVMVTGAQGGSLHVNGDYADFDIEEWHALSDSGYSIVISQLPSAISLSRSGVSPTGVLLPVSRSTAKWDSISVT